MEENILRLLKSPIEANQQLGLGFIESLGVDCSDFFKPLQEIHFLLEGYDGSNQELIWLYNQPQVYLNGIGLKTLPESIGCLVNVEELYLSYNELTELPNCIDNLKKLKCLDISHNNFHHFNIKNDLNCLMADGNFLTQIPNCVFSLTNLETLVLGENKICFLTSDIIRLKKLKRLYLNSNGIMNIPIDIYSLANLELLNLMGNKIRKKHSKIIYEKFRSKGTSVII